MMEATAGTGGWFAVIYIGGMWALVLGLACICDKFFGKH
jgi:hypothetical protein